MDQLRRRPQRTLLAVLLVFSLATATNAVDYTWNGGGTTNNWSDGDNWSGGAAPTGAATAGLIFAGTTRVNPNVNDLGDLVFDKFQLNSLTFNSGAGAFSLSGDTLNFLTNISGPTINQNSSTAITIANNIELTNSLTYTGSGSATLSGIISETVSSGLTKTGSGTLTLSGNNSYSGVTTISGGTLSVSSLADGASNSNIGASTNAATNLVLDGGTLKYTGGTASSDRLFSVGTSGGTLDASGTGALNLSNTGSIGFNGQTGTRTLTLTGTNSDANTLAAIIANDGGSNATSVVKSGSGTWVLSATNSYSGGTTINAGVLKVSANANLGASTSGNIITFDGGTLQFGASFNPSSTRPVTLNSGGGTIDTNSFSTSIASVISGTGSLTKSGSGTLTLTSATSSYTGATIIQGGTLAISNIQNGGTNSRIGASSNDAANLVLNGGTFRFTGASGFGSSDRLFSVGTLSGTIDGSGASDGALNFTNTGSMGFNSQSGARTLTLTGSSAGDNTLIPVIGDSGGATSVVKSGAGKWILGGSNTYTGGTTVDAGTLTINTATGLGSSSGSLAVNGGTLNLYTSGDTTAGSLSGTGGTINLSSGRSLTINQTTNGNFAGVIAGDSSISFTLGSSSTAALILSGTNTYGNGTTINAGTLLVTGSLGGGQVTVNSGGTLGGDLNTALGVVQVNDGGKIAPGLGDTTTGQLKVGNNVTFGSTSVFEVQLKGISAGTGYDQLFMEGGNVVLNGTLSATFSDFTPNGTEKLYIINNSGGGSLNGTFSNYANGATVAPNYGGFSWKIYYGADASTGMLSGGNDVVLTPVPEPGSIMLISALAGGLGYVVRRRSRSKHVVAWTAGQAPLAQR